MKLSIKYPNIVRFTFLQLTVLSMPLFVLNVKYMSELIIFILIIFGIYFSTYEKVLPFMHDQLKLYSYLIFVFFLSIVMSVILSDNPSHGISKIGSNIHFLVAPFVAYSIFKCNVNFKHMVLAIKLSIIIGSIYAVYQNSYLGIDRVEAGADSPTIFGFIMVFFAFVAIIDVWSQTNKEKLFSFLIFLLASYSIILSGTRISWMIFLVLFFSVIFIWFIQGCLTKKGLLLIVVTAVITTVFFIHSKQVNDRINVAFEEIKTFSKNKNSYGSIDLRLSMWRGGLAAFKQQPIIGYGYQNTGLAASRYTSGSYEKGLIKGQKMLHNDYINSLVGFGIVGLLVLLMLLFLPLAIFFKRLRTNKDFTKNAIGLLFIIALSVYAITDSIYSHNVMRSFVVFFLGVLLPVPTKSRLTS
ncbi:O-antigen polymerase [Candidatus Ruthia magnifica str. Cm (Calyptogena magnifica)]|uniref:O-antigen polymerase n=1 Tax=Ruthia magnifica subsp. Calyptogena magnifica TaxID=413404 RepID=A1AXG4_RUTMC|nr:O-antigen ligase family protein [Candidatus Ruthturnera calyptogenae]ABL02621.1 O-antigen polymerase [Candidatus Ruthia magnifica str. Cm (Calyptogena magnifica)]